jgi:hypothetical protein
MDEKLIKSGKYIGYLTTLESSAILWSDNIEDIKKEWSFGTTIFESNGVDAIKLKEIFPEPPKRGMILDYLKNNHVCVYRDGQIIGELSQSDPDIRKSKIEHLNKQ